MQTTLQVTGMSCMGCVNSVKRLLSAVDGVQSIEVDLAKGLVSVDHSEQVAVETLRDTIDSGGYKVVATN